MSTRAAVFARGNDGTPETRGKSGHRMDRLFAAAILLVNGWIFALPVAEADRIWIARVQVARGFFIHEALLVLYFALSFISLRHFFVPSARTRTVGLLIAAFGVIGVLSVLANFRPLNELLGTGRYLLLAAYFVAAVRWANRYGPTFVLRNFLLGIAASGGVNLYYALASEVRVGGLPMLIGQNGPGGPLGISVVLSAWLMMERRSARDTTIAIVTLLIGGFGSSISFSKLAMLMAGAGVAAWMFVIGRKLTVRNSRKLAIAAVVAITSVAALRTDLVVAYATGVNTYITLKFRNLNMESTNARAQYFLITAEILARNPVFGVSSHGFYEAVVGTDAYRTSWRAVQEDVGAGARGESNPHNSFLYYAAANGLPGLFLSILLFSTAVRVFNRALRERGLAGKVLQACLVTAYLVFGFTLPTLFNTSILYVPLAFGVAIGGVTSTSRTRNRLRAAEIAGSKLSRSMREEASKTARMLPRDSSLSSSGDV